MKLYITLVFFFLCIISYSQKENAWWVFGTEAAIEFTDSGIQNRSNDNNIITSNFDGQTGSSSISDSNGNLLFFTDGTKIYDKRGIVMPNGNGLAGGSSSMIIPASNTNGVYYIFTDGITPSQGFTYSRIEMQLNGGFGDIVPGVKNIILLKGTTGNISGIKKTNSNNIYITCFAHSNSTSTSNGTGNPNSLFTYEMVQMGNISFVSPTPIVQSNNFNKNYFESDILEASINIRISKFSPNGIYFAISNHPHSPLTSDTNPGIFLLNFNPSNGQFSGPVLQLDNLRSYGLEFSIDSNFLYYGSTENSNINNSITQYDLTNPSNILNTKNTITTFPGISNQSLQLGMDGEIYSTHNSSDSFIGIINNSTSTNATHISNLIDLSPGLKGGLPNILPSLILSNYNETLSLREVNKIDINVYPNPTSDYLYIETKELLSNVAIINSNGKEVLTVSNTNSLEFKIDCSNLSSGMYFAHLITKNGNTSVHKIMVD